MVSLAELRDHILDIGLGQFIVDLNLRATFHPDEDLVILNYDMLDTPKADPYGQKCRGLVLDINTLQPVAKAFDRFFNIGECNTSIKDFDLPSLRVEEKADGSLIIVYYYNGFWRMNTRGSFGQGQVCDMVGMTWYDLFYMATGVKHIAEFGGALEENFSMEAREFSWVFELCSRYNKVVTDYPEPTLFYLTSFHMPDGKEDPTDFKFYIDNPPTVEPGTWTMGVWTESLERTEDIIYKLLSSKVERKADFEGFVLVDDNYTRGKLKSKTYLALHQLKGEGKVSIERLIDIIFKGELDEILAYFPEIEDYCRDIEKQMEDLFISAWTLYNKSLTCADRKEFAMSVKDHPLASLLFTVYNKYGVEATVLQAEEVYKGMGLFLSKLFKKNEGEAD